MRKERILIVAADDSLATNVGKALQDAEYKVSRARDGIDGIKKVSRARPDLVIIERGMPLINREEACSRIRQAGYLPIIVVGKEQDAVEMLESGADAYVNRASEMREILARVRGLLWRKLRMEPRDKSRNSSSVSRPAQQPAAKLAKRSLVSSSRGINSVQLPLSVDGMPATDTTE